MATEEEAATAATKKAKPSMKKAIAEAYQKKHPELTDEQLDALVNEVQEEAGGEDTLETFISEVAANAGRLHELPPEAQRSVMEYQLARSQSGGRKGADDDGLDDDLLQFTKRIIALGHRRGQRVEDGRRGPEAARCHERRDQADARGETGRRATGLQGRVLREAGRYRRGSGRSYQRAQGEPNRRDRQAGD